MARGAQRACRDARSRAVHPLRHGAERTERSDETQAWLRSSYGVKFDFKLMLLQLPHGPGCNMFHRFITAAPPRGGSPTACACCGRCFQHRRAHLAKLQRNFQPLKRMTGLRANDELRHHEEHARNLRLRTVMPTRLPRLAPAAGWKLLILPLSEQPIEIQVHLPLQEILRCEIASYSRKHRCGNLILCELGTVMINDALL